MNIPNFFARLLFALVFIPGAAMAQQYKDMAGYRVHYSAFTSDTLGAEVANAYELKRSSNTATINIAVQLADQKKPVSARVEATAYTLLGQVFEIPMREIREEESYYSIGQWPVEHREHYRIDLEIRVKDGPLLTMTFNQVFYTR